MKRINDMWMVSHNRNPARALWMPHDLSTPPSTTKTINTTCAQTSEPRGTRSQFITDVKRCQLFLFEMEVETDRSREISGGAKGAAPTTLECFLQDTASHRRQDVQLVVQAHPWAALAACSAAKLNLEYERKEDETEDKAESGKTDDIAR